MLVHISGSVCGQSAVLAGVGRRRDDSRHLRKAGKTGSGKSEYPQPGKKVLLIGRIRELALYRSEYLRAKGFSVIIPAGKAEVLEAIRRGGYDVVVLTYTLSSENVLEFAEMVRQHYPRCPVIVISNDGKTDREVNPDAMVLADDGPNGLLSALFRVSNRKLQ